MCKRVSKAIGSLLLAVSIWPSAYASDLGILNGTNDIEGATTEFSNPDGLSCRFRDTELPSVSFGMGLSRGGFMSQSDSNRSWTKRAEPEPVVGVVVRVPFGGRTDDCNTFLKIEDAMIRFNKAMELFDNGLITQEELEAVASRAYEIINDF